MSRANSTRFARRRRCSKGRWRRDREYVFGGWSYGYADAGAVLDIEIRRAGFTDVPTVELGALNVRVNAILPGLVNGPRGRRVMEEQARARGMTLEEYLPFMLHNISMHTVIEMEEIAALAIFLASDHAKHITGQSIGVCGNFETYRAPLSP
jgi:hypothetical protein